MRHHRRGHLREERDPSPSLDPQARARAMTTAPAAARTGHSVQLEAITHRFGATTAACGVLFFSTALLVVVMDRIAGLTRRIS
jgi:hypothetical protein